GVSNRSASRNVQTSYSDSDPSNNPISKVSLPFYHFHQSRYHSPVLQIAISSLGRAHKGKMPLPVSYAPAPLPTPWSNNYPARYHIAGFYTLIAVHHAIPYTTRIAVFRNHAHQRKGV